MLAQLRTIKTELAKSGGGGGASSKEMEALRDAGKIEAIGPVLCIFLRSTDSRPVSRWQDDSQMKELEGRVAALELAKKFEATAWF